MLTSKEELCGEVEGKEELQKSRKGNSGDRVNLLGVRPLSILLQPTISMIFTRSFIEVEVYSGMIHVALSVSILQEFSQKVVKVSFSTV